MLTITNNNIHLTRGDTMLLDLSLSDESGNPYIPDVGDSIFFRLKKDASSETVYIEKTADMEELLLRLDPNDTADLSFGMYCYEIELVTSAGYHFTVVENARFEIGKELENHE